MKTERSLKSRALQLLAQRDQSRLELRRKLLRFARAAAQAARAGIEPDALDGGGEGEPAATATVADMAAEVDALLDWLEANRFLSDERFAESRVHARASRFGLLRIRHELAQHAVGLSPELEQNLAASELERAAAIRQRRFDGAPTDAAGRAAQSRFLLARGFSGDVVQRLMRRLARGGGAAAGAPFADD